MERGLFPTTVVGSMPRPQYVRDLIESQVEGGGSSGDFRRMMDSAIPYVAQMQELAGIDIISDGEWRRKSYVGVIADICSGFDLSIKEVLGQRQTWHVVTSKIEVAKPRPAGEGGTVPQTAYGTGCQGRHTIAIPDR